MHSRVGRRGVIVCAGFGPCLRRRGLGLFDEESRRGEVCCRLVEARLCNNLWGLG